MTYTFGIEDFVEARKQLAKQVRLERRFGLTDFREIAGEEGFNNTKHKYIQYVNRGARRVIDSALADNDRVFWLTKPTLENLITLRNTARMIYERYKEYREARSYVMSDGYSLCGTDDYEWEVLQQHKMNVLCLTAIIVKMKKGAYERQAV